tara:strand:+ start:212 stop:439 length:228 start_codon:yes stop_codon:yes gene_type:complete
MENSYTRWLELEEERKEKTNITETSNIASIKDAMNGISEERSFYWAQEIVKAVYEEDNYYDAYERVHKMLINFLK